MDRKKQEIKDLNKQTTPTTKQATTISTTPTDDDTSTESSDTFETWTLLNDKEKSKLEESFDNDNGKRIEILKNSNNNDEQDHRGAKSKTEQEPQQQDSLNDISNDDFSDGISIISESESVDRISPHPYIRDHLHELNLKFTLSDHMDDTILNRMREEMENDTAVPLLIQQQPEELDSGSQQLRQRRRASTAPAADDDNQALQKASQTVAIGGELVPLVKRGLQGIFYIGVGLALLGLIGKIVHPTWQPLASVVNSSPSMLELEQKVNDMELQNNLMRAEIDLLNKQVKYLSSLNDAQQTKPSGKYKDYKESKTFKAWSGNGDSLKPVDITKKDLKKPYKCPDGSFVEIANMCIERRPTDEPSIIDQFGQVVENFKEQSEAFKAFEQVAEELQDFQENPFERLQDMLSEQANPETQTPKQFIKNKPIYESSKDNKENQNYRPKGEDSNFSATHKHNKYAAKAEGKNESSKESRKPLYKNEYKQNVPDHGKFHDNSQERNHWKTDKFGNDSKERKYRKDNSKERYTKNFNDDYSKGNQSKERYNNKQKRKHDDDDDDSGEWQEKYMKHREHQRKQNEQKYQDNKNWYIKRGNSRENKRSGEKEFR